MVRYVFFSFHYERDVWRANQVRNSWITKPDRVAAGFVDAAAFEEVKKKGDAAVKKWIDDQLSGTSVTVVLIGSETSTRPFVEYEIKQSYGKNGLLGLYIHNLKDQNQKTDIKGSNPFDSYYITQPDGSKKYLSSMYSTYDWVSDNGYDNLGKWIEEAAKKAGR
jgi:hypothetical protein